MAVLQISKIQVRRGQKSQSGIPTLSAGEFAWAVDAQELYIGNGSVGEGAPFVGNTRLLTELDASNIFKLAGTYAYEGNTSATIITGPDANSPVSRTLQDKLDDYVSLADFGAIGNGIVNDTKALQRAIDQIYLNSDKANNGNHQNRKKLRFPAGTYLITGTIYIPSHAVIEGDGIDRTVIKQSTTATAIFQTVDFSSTAISKVTLDSGTPFSQPPTNISVSGMTLQYDLNTKQGSGPLFFVDCAYDTVIKDVKFLGVAVSPGNDQQESIQIRGQGTTTTKNLKIKDCVFKNIAFGVVSDYDCSYIEISGSKFDGLTYGVKFSETVTGISPKIHGPTNVLISNSIFDNIDRSAIKGGANSAGVIANITSEHNKFYNCGNGGSLNTEDAQADAVIELLGNGSKSVNDWFKRTEANQAGVAGLTVPEAFGHFDFKPQAPQAKVLAVQSSPTTLAVIPKPPFGEFKVTLDYIARQSALNVTRVGQVQVMTNVTTATWSDSFQYVGANSLSGDVEFTASLNTATQTLTIDVTNPIGSVETNLTYQYSLLY